MKAKKINYEIVPIFNQSANAAVLRSFTDLEMKCDIIKYGYHSDEADWARIMQSHKDDLAHMKYNFAFGAYSAGNTMLGFANGYLYDKRMYLRNLYVDPKYNGNGIGRTLLKATENAASLVSSYMEVVSLAGATSFYELNGYTNFDDRNMGKSLPKDTLGVVPVFGWGRALRAKLNVAPDVDLLKAAKNQPIFVYVNPDFKIDGVAMRDNKGEDAIWTNDKKGRVMAQFYQQQLIKALDRVK